MRILTSLMFTLTLGATPATYIYVGEPMTPLLGSCLDPCQITGFFTVTDKVPIGVGPETTMDVTDITDFGFGLNGKDTFTPANSSIGVRVDTLEYLPGTGVLTTNCNDFCYWDVNIEGTRGSITTVGGIAGGIIFTGNETVDIPGLYIENLERPGIWTDPRPTPEPSSFALFLGAALFLVAIALMLRKI